MTELKKGFFWGNSTSSMQTEGAFDEGGKGKSVYDKRPAGKNSSDWQTAIDEYHRYPEDIELMKDMGMNFYRFQISWSRVCPDGDGKFNEEGIQFYSRLIDNLIDANITPMICLYHFDMPLHLAEKYNGFVSDYVVKAFIRYGKEMVDRFGDRVKYWITFNEQNLYSIPDAFEISGYVGNKSIRDLYQIQQHVITCHAAMANYIHDVHQDLQIGGMLAYQEFYPHSSLPNDIAIARKFNEFVNTNLIKLFTSGRYSNEVLTYMESKGLSDLFDPDEMKIIRRCSSDFLSFSYYSTATLDSTKIPVNTCPNFYGITGAVSNPYLQSNEWNWQIDPVGFRTVLTTIYNESGLPVFPIENGIGVREEWDGNHLIQDDYRISYHREHIQALKDAVREDGVDVMGYLGWGLIDIPSSSGNVDKRYGMVFVNRTNHDLKDMKRIPKKSYYWFKNVISSNGDFL
ncbi:MAG TPA: glycoside hydrolase family 1 protein [Candidatus Enterococcus avicola]|uniref:Glycoside hydrolase family 1 protein n=1 Tax=Candidatus Enterococcus avicola TaxID=2838561 RepID=A0A9D2JGF7_9ENTE|nr:glycoside hydrolase family 1 protein [Candidatus Enterococcus avicola]